MRFLAFSAEYPTNEDPGIHPDVLALHPAARHDVALDELVRNIANGQDGSIRHDAIKVSSNSSPFINAESYALFTEVLACLHEMRFLPPDLLIREEEWGDDGYPVGETIYGGNRGKKPIPIDLPASIWLPRAILWTQALTAMRHVLAYVSV